MLATPALCGIVKKIQWKRTCFSSRNHRLQFIFKYSLQIQHVSESSGFAVSFTTFFGAQRSVLHVIPCIEIHFATSCTVLYFHAYPRNLLYFAILVTRTYISSNLTCFSPGSIFLIDSIGQGDKVSTHPSNTTQ